MSSNWPPALKTFVNETFAKCTEANRPAVEAELKDLIFKAYESKELWTIDWPNVKLASLGSKKKRKPAFAPSTPASYGVTNVATAQEDDRREKRLKRFEADKAAAAAASATSAGSSFISPGRAAIRSKFAQSMYNTPTPEPEAHYDPNVIDWDKHTIVGTSTKLEKPFLRLTSVPDPSTIRPLPVLKNTLEFLKKKWRQDNNYGYICDQFKSMRQDLTVQRIKNDFTVIVYEIHARIALEKGDLGEFNQCQGQLRELYKHGIPGHVMEFLGYRILYLLFSRNRAELNTTLANLTDRETKDESVSHALAVRLAVSQGNYTKFFRLFLAAPKMGAYIMDHFVPRERVAALVTMTKAYQQLPITLIISLLAFDSAAEAIAFLSQFNAAAFKTSATLAAASARDEDKVVDCKVAHVHLAAALTKMAKVDLKGQI
ncbi:hypothetical protein OIO90_006489 [Microbotryomycetes sp. JL221]|nr:hypothetical protein OIO90_006489 [Microbotryomycetes sp. JL221]